MKSVVLSIALSLTLSLVVAADDPPAAEARSFTLPSIEEKYASEAAKADAVVAKAEAEAAKTKKFAAEARLKAYKDKLVEITKTGDFDKAQLVKAKITQLEAATEGDAHEKHSKRPRPKETVKFGGHTYALIKEPATWHVAKLRCEEMGGHLVCINSAKESEFIAGLSGKSLVAIGASDEIQEGVLVNVDGTMPVFAAAPVSSGQASDHSVVWDGGRFVIWQGGARVAYICEWDR